MPAELQVLQPHDLDEVTGMKARRRGVEPDVSRDHLGVEQPGERLVFRFIVGRLMDETAIA